jgi:hypothetical protein
VLKNVFGLKRGEVTGGWRKVSNEELRGFYSSPGIIRIIKSRSKRWAGLVARMGEKRYPIAVTLVLSISRKFIIALSHYPY